MATFFVDQETVLYSLLHNGAQWPADFKRMHPTASMASIVRVFRSLWAKGAIYVTPYGFKARAKYRMYRHTKRLIDTHSVKPKNKWDPKKMDLELTCEGLAPLRAEPAVIDGVVNPKMVAAALAELANNGMLLVSGTKPGDAFGYNEWKVTGGEWLDRLADTWDPDWAVEIELVNNVGRRYTFHTSFKVRVKDFVVEND